MSSHDQFTRQVDAHYDQVLSFARSLLQEKTKAEDVTQEVFIRLWEHREEVDLERALPWLLTVTRNACIDRHRRRQSRQKKITVNSDGLSQAPAPHPSPEKATEVEDFKRHLSAALDRINDPYRRVVVLRELQELKYKEIAETLDMPLNTVKVYIHRGRKKLRRQLSKQIEVAAP